MSEEVAYRKQVRSPAAGPLANGTPIPGGATGIRTECGDSAALAVVHWSLLGMWMTLVLILWEVW